mmetsp:Transcript_19746/g.50075  ORF Transcript_19746/g.50075 Transcript_19746/m.50075 type:complete len:320 (-) Transcript_19746:4946-5905(-)
MLFAKLRGADGVGRRLDTHCGLLCLFRFAWDLQGLDYRRSDEIKILRTSRRRHSWDGLRDWWQPEIFIISNTSVYQILLDDRKRSRKRKPIGSLKILIADFILGSEQLCPAQHARIVGGFKVLFPWWRSTISLEINELTNSLALLDNLFQLIVLPAVERSADETNQQSRASSCTDSRSSTNPTASFTGSDSCGQTASGLGGSVQRNITTAPLPDVGIVLGAHQQMRAVWWNDCIHWNPGNRHRQSSSTSPVPHPGRCQGGAERLVCCCSPKDLEERHRSFSDEINRDTPTNLIWIRIQIFERKPEAGFHRRGGRILPVM